MTEPFDVEHVLKNATLSEKVSLLAGMLPLALLFFSLERSLLGFSMLTS